MNKEEKKRKSVLERFLTYAAVTLFLTLAAGTAITENMYGVNAAVIPLSVKRPLIIISIIISIIIPYLIIKKQKKDDARQQEKKERQRLLEIQINIENRILQEKSDKT